MLPVFQKTGALFLANRRVALLADEMRVGKTPQAIHAADMRNFRTRLVLCPPVAVFNWAAEWERFSADVGLLGMPVNAVTCGADSISEEGINIVPYSLIDNESLRDEVLRVQPECVILDEVHYLKSPTAKRTQAVYGNAKARKPGIVQGAKSCWGLSGTPMPNNPAELFPLLAVAGIYRESYATFVHTYCTLRKAKHGDQITGAKNEEELKALLAPLMLRRTRAEVFGETPVSVSQYYVKPQAFPVEVGSRDAFTGKSDEEILAELRAAAPHLATERKLTALAKVRAAADYLDHYLTVYDEPVVVFSFHPEVLRALQKELHNYKVSLIDGSTPTRARAEEVKKFRTGETEIFLGQLVAAGEAIDLSVANHMVFIDLDWTPKTNEQAAARCSGMNQTRPVDAVTLTIPNSIDDVITRVLTRKMQTIATIID